MSAQSQIFNPTLRTSQASGDGFSCPVMNTASRLTLNFGVSDKGMMVYDTTLSNVMFWTGTVWLPLGGGLVPVGASLNTQVIYNNAGVLEGDAGLTYNNATDALTIAGPATVQGVTVGKGTGADATNTVFGTNGLQVRTIATSCSIFGAAAGGSITTGVRNTLFGTSAGGSLSIGAQNTIVGMGTLQLCVSGDFNTTCGEVCLNVATGSDNTAIGARSFSVLTTGDGNTGCGRAAGGSQTSGSNNGFFGNGATGDSNIASNSYNYGNASVTSHKFRAGDVVVGTGNVVMSTSGRGIDFSATGGAGTSELFHDYEEGTWTPTDSSGAALPFITTKCRYTKIGRAVTIQGLIQYPVNISAAPAGFQSFPFLSADMLPLFIAFDGSSTVADSLYGATTFVNFYLTGAIVLNSALSGVSVSFSGTYMT